MPKARILLFGHDDALLYSRALLLRSRGFETASASTVEMVEEALGVRDGDEDGFNLLLVCHTVPREAGDRVIASARQADPSLRFLELSPPAYSGQYLMLDATRGPEMLLAAVEQALAGPRSGQSPE